MPKRGNARRTSLGLGFLLPGGWRVAGMAATVLVAACPARGSAGLAVPLPRPAVHPVVVVPGAPGTFLADPASGELVWGRMEVRLGPAPGFWDRLALPAAGRAGPAGLRDELVPAGIMERVPVVVAGVRSEWTVYADLIAAATPVLDGRREPGLVACFGYDWRLDIAANGARLHRFVEAWRARLRAERPDLFPPGGELRCDVVAHSMGALVTRYALRHGALPLEQALARPGRDWPGAAWCRRVVMLDPPNQGSLASLLRLNEGFAYSALLPRVPAAVLGTMPSLYQVLPGPAAAVVESPLAPGQPLALWDPHTWLEHRWGLLGPAGETAWSDCCPQPGPACRRELALRHVAQCLRRGEQLQRVLDASGPPPPGLEFHLLTGGGVSTPVRAEVDPASGRLRVTARASGDTVVPVASALWLPGADGRPAADPACWASVLVGREHHMTGLLDRAWNRRIRRILGEPSPRLADDTRWLGRLAPRRQGPR